MLETKYEITYIIRPDLENDAKQSLIERFDKILSDNGAKIIDSKDWDTRRFAYEINGFNEGTYHIINLTTDNAEALMNLIV